MAHAALTEAVEWCAKRLNGIRVPRGRLLAYDLHLGTIRNAGKGLTPSHLVYFGQLMFHVHGMRHHGDWSQRSLFPARLLLESSSIPSAWSTFIEIMSYGQLRLRSMTNNLLRRLENKTYDPGFPTIMISVSALAREVALVPFLHSSADVPGSNMLIFTRLDRYSRLSCRWNGSPIHF